MKTLRLQVAPADRSDRDTDQQRTALRRRVAGLVFGSDEPGYLEATSNFNTMVTHRPTLVVVAADEQDAAVTIRRASGTRNPLTVLGSGHGLTAPVDGGWMLNLRRLNEVKVNASARTARVAAGATWQDVLAAAEPFGLAPVCGSASHVGVTGFLLGGGVGPLARADGFGSDHVEALDVVLEDGSRCTASTTSEPDLFWGLRGGKYGLGTVTAVTIRLVPRTHLWGLSAYYPATAVPDLLHGFQDLTAHLDGSSLTTSVAVLRLPNLAALPAELRGRTVGHLRAAHPDPDSAETRAASAALAVLQSRLPPPLLGGSRVLPCAEIGTIHNDPVQPRAHVSAGALLPQLAPTTVDALLGVIGPRRRDAASLVEIRHFGGALRRRSDDEDAGAVGGRTASHGVWISHQVPSSANPRSIATARQTVHAVSRAVDPSSSFPAQANFAGTENTADQVTRSWPPEIARRLDAIRSTIGSANACPRTAVEDRHVTTDDARAAVSKPTNSDRGA